MQSIIADTESCLTLILYQLWKRDERLSFSINLHLVNGNILPHTGRNTLSDLAHFPTIFVAMASQMTSGSNNQMSCRTIWFVKDQRDLFSGEGGSEDVWFLGAVRWYLAPVLSMANAIYGSNTG